MKNSIDLDELAQQKLNGESYAAIRARMKESGMPEEEIRQAIRQIDDKVIEMELRQKQQGRARRWYRSGFVLAVIGLVITLAHSRGVLPADLPRLIVYSPFIAGMLLMLYARLKGHR